MHEIMMVLLGIVLLGTFALGLLSIAATIRSSQISRLEETNIGEDISEKKAAEHTVAAVFTP